MPGDRAAVWLVPDEEDQVPRLERFRAAHPEVVILLRGTLPRAWVGGRKIERSTLRGVLDELEEIFPPDTQARRRARPTGQVGDLVEPHIVHQINCQARFRHDHLPAECTMLRLCITVHSGHPVAVSATTVPNRLRWKTSGSPA